jgi:hypothetical protein
VGVIVVATLGSGCRPDARPPHIVPDSTASLIIDSASLAEAPRLELRESLRVGDTGEGTGPLFARILGLDVGPSGEIVVLDRGAPEAVLFDSAGQPRE